jgi:membrane-bound lytic murein transglycosylase B
MGHKRRATSIGSALGSILLPLALGASGSTAPMAYVDPPRDVAATPGDAVPDDFDARVLAAGRPEAVLVSAPTVLRKKDEVEVSSPKGTRVWSVSALADHGLPVAAKRAYRDAAALMARADPACGLPWTLLAGIGRVESDHGRYGGSRLGSDGVSRPRIIGVPLDGAGPVAAIRDTDGGALDGDKVWDRAVGPMQFIPSTWRSAARDGDGDGRMSPHDLDDAAAAAAAYLCSGPGSLRDPAAQAAAIFRYNQDDYYVALVQAFEVGYRTGVFTIPSPPAEQPTAKPHRKRHHKVSGRGAHRRGKAVDDRRPRHQGKRDTSTAGSKAPSPAAKPSPNPSAKPSPKPSPTPPQPTTVTAAFTQGADGGYLLGGKPLDLGVAGQLNAAAAGDFDGNGTVATNGEELNGMLGRQVTMVVVALENGDLGIYSINGIALG